PVRPRWDKCGQGEGHGSSETGGVGGESSRSQSHCRSWCRSETRGDLPLAALLPEGLGATLSPVGKDEASQNLRRCAESKPEWLWTAVGPAKRREIERSPFLSVGHKRQMGQNPDRKVDPGQ